MFKMIREEHGEYGIQVFAIRMALPWAIPEEQAFSTTA